MSVHQTPCIVFPVPSFFSSAKVWPSRQVKLNVHLSPSACMCMYAERERCTFNLTSLLGHTSAETKKLGTGMHAPENGICHNILIKSRQHPLCVCVCACCVCVCVWCVCSC